MSREHVKADAILLLPSSDMRYQGQGFSLEVRFHRGGTSIRGAIWAALSARVHQCTMRLWLQRQSGSDRDCQHATHRHGQLPQPKFENLPERSASSAAMKGSRKRTWMEFQDVIVYARPGCAAETRGRPAVVEQLDSTTLIFPRQRAVVDDCGNLNYFAGGMA